MPFDIKKRKEKSEYSEIISAISNNSFRKR
jgi:hypothetical protein